ncbi:MAG: nucleotidyltransferase family protein [Candidatus Marinimicrobia bacterium]|nr:nucleotidyltransferase family protein [Candidatus Neomarinimicrobiota bacterium]
MNHPLKTIFNLITSKTVALKPIEIENNFEYFENYEILPFIAYHVEQKSIKLNSGILSQLLQNSRELDILRKKYFKAELRNFLEILQGEELIIFKGGIQLISPYWNNYDGYLPKDIDLLLKRNRKEKIIKLIFKNYQIVSENYNRTVIQTKDRMVTFDLHFFPVNNVPENSIIEYLIKSCNFYDFDKFKILIPSFNISLVYRLYHTFYHHNDFLPIHPFDIIDIYYLLKKSLEYENLSTTISIIDNFHLMHTFIPIYKFLKEKIRLNLPSINYINIPEKLISILFTEISYPAFLYYAFARNILLKMKKSDSTSNSDFYKLIQYRIYPEIKCDYNNLASRFFHLIKAILSSILAEFYYQKKL